MRSLPHPSSLIHPTNKAGSLFEWLTRPMEGAYSAHALDASGARFGDWEFIGAQTPYMAFFCAPVRAARALGVLRDCWGPISPVRQPDHVLPPSFGEGWGGSSTLIGVHTMSNPKSVRIIADITISPSFCNALVFDDPEGVAHYVEGLLSGCLLNRDSGITIDHITAQTRTVGGEL